MHSSAAAARDGMGLFDGSDDVAARMRLMRATGSWMSSVGRWNDGAALDESRVVEMWL
jgi:hypothetical protein